MDEPIYPESIMQYMKELYVGMKVLDIADLPPEALKEKQAWDTLINEALENYGVWGDKKMSSKVNIIWQGDSK